LQELTSRVSETDFDRFPTPFAAIATDLQSGESVALRSGNLASALRASMSLPAIFEPWERDGRLLVDGGLKANLPVLLAKKMFPGHPVIAVNLSPMSIEGKSGKLDSVFSIAAQSLEILMHDQIVENCRAADLVIQVDCKGLGTLDSDGYDKIMDRGVTAAEEKIDELKALVDSYHRYVPAAMHNGPEPSKQLIVGELVVAGVPQNIAKTFQERYRSWIGKPLDMGDISAAVKEMSARSEINSVEPKIDNISREIVRVTLDVQQPPKVELSLSGYSSNLNSDRWLSVAALGHNLLLDGDTADLELRGGTNWGIMGRYFTPLTKNNWQFGLSAALITEDNVYSENGTKYIDNGDGTTFSYTQHDPDKYKRFSGKAMIYKNLARDKIRLGIGYAFGHTDYDYGLTLSDKAYGDVRRFHTEDVTLRGITASVGINSLDDPIVPTKGFALMSDIWFPHGKNIFSRTEFTAKFPLKSNWLFSVTGGLNTAAFGLQTEGFLPPHYASLGSRNELWTLAAEPLFGEQTYWGKLSASKVLMKSWWGGINTEFFVAGGRTSIGWNETAYTAWEAGIQFGIPTNFLPGSFIVAYGQSRAHDALYDHYRPDRNEFVIGYTLGIPKWWKGPLP
ncbi:MAG: patatin-like phospholipase family protein, partial [Synergistaceae bacterium]|nr:patatin-like phospholipase family protein [Synergistaceae bacterium]